MITRVEDQILYETFHRFEGPIVKRQYRLVLRHFGFQHITKPTQLSAATTMLSLETWSPANLS